jgi:hypothetical protein
MMFYQEKTMRTAQAARPQHMLTITCGSLEGSGQLFAHLGFQVGLVRQRIGAPFLRFLAISKRLWREVQRNVALARLDPGQVHTMLGVGLYHSLAATCRAYPTLRCLVKVPVYMLHKRRSPFFSSRRLIALSLYIYVLFVGFPFVVELPFCIVRT